MLFEVFHALLINFLPFLNLFLDIVHLFASNSTIVYTDAKYLSKSNAPAASIMNIIVNLVIPCQ